MMSHRPIPISGIDLFSHESLVDPFQDYQALRDMGDVVRLKHPDVYASSRFKVVRDALRAEADLICGEGVGFTNLFNSGKGQSVLQADGGLHRRLRAVVMKPLTPAALRSARIDLKAMIARRLDSLIGAGWFNAMTMLAYF